MSKREIKEAGGQKGVKASMLSKTSYLKWIAGVGMLALIVVVALSVLAKRRAIASDAGYAPDPQNLAEMVTGLTPGGWKIYDRVRRFTPENLYSLIDGGAELYLAYDMVKMTFAIFEKNADTGTYIELSIYDMGTPTNAFGVFSAERSEGLPSLSLGRAGYRSGASYCIWQGQHYVTIMASDSTEELERIGLGLARKAMAVLPDSGEPVWGMTALPLADRVPDSVKYFKADAMGLDFMQNTYTAKYRKGNSRISVFLSRKGSPGSAQAAVAGYTRYAGDYGEGVERLTQDGIELVLCDMGGSFNVIFQKGRLVGGVMSVGDRHLAAQAAADLWRQLSYE